MRLCKRQDSSKWSDRDRIQSINQFLFWFVLYDSSTNNALLGLYPHQLGTELMRHLAHQFILTTQDKEYNQEIQTLVIVMSLIYGVPEVTVPTHLDERKTIMDRIPELIDAIRSNITQRRSSHRRFEMFLRGILVPEQPHIHKQYVEREIADFLKALQARALGQNYQYPRIDRYTIESCHYLYDHITLAARFMNLKWSKPLRYVRILTPTTREVIKKMTKCYRNVMEHILNPHERSADNNQVLSPIDHLKEIIGMDDVRIMDERMESIVHMFIARKSIRRDNTEAISAIGRTLLPLYVTNTSRTLDEDFKRCILYMIEYALVARTFPEREREKMPNSNSMIGEYFSYMQVARTDIQSNSLYDIASRIRDRHKSTVYSSNNIGSSATSLSILNRFRKVIRSNAKVLASRRARAFTDLTKLLEQFMFDSLSSLDPCDRFCSINIIQVLSHPNIAALDPYRAMNPKEVAFEQFRMKNSTPFVTSSLPRTDNNIRRPENNKLSELLKKVVDTNQQNVRLLEAEIGKFCPADYLPPGKVYL